jgi:hypothetical protein
MDIYGMTVRGPFGMAGDAYYTAEIDNGNSGAAKLINWTVGNKQKITLTGAPVATITFNNPGGCCTLSLRVIQGAGGSKTITWPVGIKWANATPPTLTIAAAAIDMVAFYFDGAVYYGIASLNFA